MKLTDRQVTIICIALERYAAREADKAAETEIEARKNVYYARAKEIRDIIEKLKKQY